MRVQLRYTLGLLAPHAVQKPNQVDLVRALTQHVHSFCTFGCRQRRLRQSLRNNVGLPSRLQLLYDRRMHYTGIDQQDIMPTFLQVRHLISLGGC